MPNTTVPAAAIGLPAQPQPTRRIFLAAAGPAATVFASLGAAAVASAPSELLDLGRRLTAAWASERAIIDRDDASEEEISAAMDITSAIVREIIGVRATTFEELKVKARALAWCHGGAFEGIADAACIGFVDGRIVKETTATDFFVADSILFDLTAIAGNE